MFGKFGKKKKVDNKAPKVDETLLVNPLDAPLNKKKEDPSGLIKGIVSTETAEGVDNILDAAPEVDTSLLQDIEPQKSILLMILQILFVILVVGGLASLVFFTSQLTNRFDFITSRLGVPNISKELTSTNSEILTLQSDLNFYRYLQVKAYLSEFSFYGDTFIQSYEVANSQTATSKQKANAEDEMEALRNNIREAFLTAEEKYLLQFDAPLFSQEEAGALEITAQFANKLTTILSEKSAELATNFDESAQRDFKNYTHTMNLIGNAELKKLMLATDFDNLSNEELYGLIKSVNSLILNDLSIIQEIKDQRVKWSDIINEIELRTIDADRFYNQGTYNQLGGIRYTSYDFDSESRSIDIAGETLLFDTKNFTLISNLIDKLNDSPFFENAEMRSFNKSGSLDAGYTSSLKLSLDLQEGDLSENDKSIDIEIIPN